MLNSPEMSCHSKTLLLRFGKRTRRACWNYLYACKRLYVVQCKQVPVPLNSENNASPSRAPSADTTSAPAYRGGAGGGSRCFLTRIAASGVGSTTAELGLVPQVRSWETRALLRLPYWDAASSAVLLGLENAVTASCPSGEGPLCYLYSRSFPPRNLDFAAFQGHTPPVFRWSFFNLCSSAGTSYSNDYCAQ